MSDPCSRRSRVSGTPRLSKRNVSFVGTVAVSLVLAALGVECASRWFPLTAFITGGSDSVALSSCCSATLRMGGKKARVTAHVAGDFTGGMAREWLTAQGYEVLSESAQGGSSWASCQIVKTSAGDFFVKTSSKPADEMFKGEALGLRALRAAGAVHVPEVLHYGDAGPGRSFIIMEKLDLRGKQNMREFGRAMAQMHLAEPSHAEAKAGKFGFEVDNTIGGTPQPNPWTDDWVEFFREHRIGFQVSRARNAWELKDVWKRVLDSTDGLRTMFTDGEIKPSVLHGDLWSGNYDATPQGMAIYDPATYYGHHEAEWGMSWCAGFNKEFWAGYRELIPEAPQFRKRRKLYQAYHIINHYNLFGGGYLEDGIGLLEELL